MIRSRSIVITPEESKTVIDPFETINLLRSYKYSRDSNKRLAYQWLRKYCIKRNQTLFDMKYNFRHIHTEGFKNDLEKKKKKFERKYGKSKYQKPRWIQ